MVVGGVPVWLLLILSLCSAICTGFLCIELYVSITCVDVL